MPYQLIQERYFTQQNEKSPFSRNATFFQDLVIRCVRYAFACIPASVGREFFGKYVSIPFIRFRMLRQGYLFSPVAYRDMDQNGAKGILIAGDAGGEIDLLIYYCHGGGFSMGSSYFYMEFLMAWVDVLKQAGYRNPAVFALEYELVPDRVYPAQAKETLSGYQVCLDLVGGDAERICVSGDSAGGTLVLSLLLNLGAVQDQIERQRIKPGYAVLVSPWTMLVSSLNRDTKSDYLNAESLHLYAKQYAGDRTSLEDPRVSPGKCDDASWWQSACPRNGFGCVFGEEEVFAPEIKRWIGDVRKAGCHCDFKEEPAGIHAWPVVGLFLSEVADQRLKGLAQMTSLVKDRMRAKK